MTSIYHYVLINSIYAALPKDILISFGSEKRSNKAQTFRCIWCAAMIQLKAAKHFSQLLINSIPIMRLSFIGQTIIKLSTMMDDPCRKRVKNFAFM